MARISWFRAWVLALLVAGGTAQAEAQNTAGTVMAAEVDVASALAASVCLPEATELGSAATRLRAESDALLVRALTSYVTTLRSQLAACMRATRPDGSGTSSPPPRGRVAVSADEAEASGRGTFDMQQVVRLIHTRLVAITRCYETQLATAPQLAGRVRVTMTIARSGSVRGVRAIENTTGSDAVAACVVRVLQGFRFDPGPTGGTVTYTFPFTFSPAD
jgi:TonB family protein